MLIAESEAGSFFVVIAFGVPSSRTQMGTKSVSNLGTLRFFTTIYLVFWSKAKATSYSTKRVDFNVISCISLGISRYIVSSRYTIFESILDKYYFSDERN